MASCSISWPKDQVYTFLNGDIRIAIIQDGREVVMTAREWHALSALERPPESIAAWKMTQEENDYLREELAKSPPEGRNAVLEEAAKICDGIAREWIKDRDSHASRAFYSAANAANDHASGAEECADAIRALKDETDDASTISEKK